jgi:hypothetical protein
LLLIGEKQWDSNTRIAVVEGRVAKSVSERVERLALEVAICPIGHRIIVEGGQIVEVPVKSYGKPSAGADIPGDEFGDCGSSCLARVPSLKDCGNMLRSPIRLSGGGNAFK